MSARSLSNLASVAEIGAAIVVVISLIFIYQELEQNTLSTQDASYRQFLSNLTGLDLGEASDPELSRISSTGELYPDNLSDEDWIRFSKIASARLAQMEYAFLSRSNETMSDIHWQAVEPHLRYLFCLPGYRKFMNSGMDEIFSTIFLTYLTDVVYPSCG